MELLQVFDENKNMLNESVERSNKTLLEDGKYFMVILIFIENNNKFLIQKTSENKNSEYATTGGHVTYKDTGDITCLKEVEEELGIKLSINDIEHIETVKYKKCYFEIYYTSKKINIEDLKIQKEEVESVNWLSIDEINKLIDKEKFRKSNIEPFNKVLKYKGIK